MNFSANRSALGILSVIVFFLSVYLLLSLSSAAGWDAGHPRMDMTAAVITAINVAILFAWVSSGLLGGIAMTAVSIVVVSWIDLRSGLYGNWFFTLPFIVTSIIGYRYAVARQRLEGLYELRTGKTEEDANILVNEMEEKNRSIAALENKLRRYSALRKVVESLSALLSLDEINRVIVDKAAEMIGGAGSRSMLLAVDTQKQSLMLSASSGGPRIMEKTGDIFDRWVLRHRTSLIVEDIERDFRFSTDDKTVLKGSFRSLIAVPLSVEDKMIGILRMEGPADMLYTQDDLRLLGIIADLGAVVTHNAMLYSRTQELATTDGLTGLVIRRYFLERLKEEMKRAARKKEKLFLLLLDIDHFKAYNDERGHTAGDLVLKHIANILKPMVREGDIITRYGGEEIGILLCGRDKKTAVQEAERIRIQIEKKPLALRRHEARITVSIGVARYPDDASTEEEFIKAADERLYKAKAAGRNKVVS